VTEGMQINISDELRNFFLIEIDNEHDEETGNSRSGSSSPGGVSPATLGSATDSLHQAPDDVVAEWFGLETVDTEAINRISQELEDLIDRHGEDALLVDFL
jgi:hypothetical protein